MQVHKQEFDLFRGASELRLELPRGCRVLRVSRQFETGPKTFVWYTTKTPDMHGCETLTIHAVGTGQEFPASWQDFYIGTEIYHGGQLVFHFFAVPDRVPV